MQRFSVLIPLLILATFSASALDTQTRPVGPVQLWDAADLETFDEHWLHVKFVEGSDVNWVGAEFADDSGRNLAGLNAAIAFEQVTDVQRTFSRDRVTLRNWKARGEAKTGVVGPDLSLWYNVRVESGREAVARLLNELNADPSVEIAHPVAIPETAGLYFTESTPVGGDRLPTPDFTDMQDYLYDTPVGLDAPSAWAEDGGKGALVKFIDVELCWTEDHEDFTFANNFYVGGAAQDPSYETHGTAVLGEVIGVHNGFGVSGFAPDVQYGVVAVTVGEWPEVPHYFQEAVDNLDTGDVWLIELQMYPPGASATPMEWLQVNYDVIWTSSWALDIICVEAGANGSQDLDSSFWDGVFDRNIRDSGAIMVGAGTPYGRVAESFTNYGSRMDVHAWGSSIVTTGYGDLYNGGTLQTRYTSGFGGTSGASPMITGSVAALQGIVKANNPEPMSPLELRTILHDTGIDHLDPTREIGPRPDLAAAVAELPTFSSVDDGRATAISTPWLRAANPFVAGGELRLSLNPGSTAELELYDVSGRQVRTLFNAPVGAGEQVISWDGSDEGGNPMASGVYYLHLGTKNQFDIERIVMVR